jgi:hypothetical protein
MHACKRGRVDVVQLLLQHKTKTTRRVYKVVDSTYCLDPIIATIDSGCPKHVIKQILQVLFKNDPYYLFETYDKMFTAFENFQEWTKLMECTSENASIHQIIYNTYRTNIIEILKDKDTKSYNYLYKSYLFDRNIINIILNFLTGNIKKNKIHQTYKRKKLN